MVIAIQIKFSRYLVVLAAVGLLAACGGGGANSEVESVVQTKTEKTSSTITFLQINDLHAHLTPHADQALVDGQIKLVQRGGLARLATLIESIRLENPDTVLMNIGDTYHGGVEALFTYGNAIVAPVNALNIDVGVPGNWDFAYGPVVTRARYTDERGVLPPGVSQILQPDFPNLAANVSNTLPPRSGQPFLPPTLLKDIGGVVIGFIGLTSDIVPRMSPALALGLDFLQGEANYLTLVESLSAKLKQQGAMIVVVMSELGIHKDYRLASRIQPNTVDVFFSAHTHEATRQPLQASSGAWVVEAGNDTYLGRLDMTVTNGQVTGRHWQLLTIDNKIAEQANVNRLVEEARAPFLGSEVNMSLTTATTTLRLTQPIDTLVGYQGHGLDRRQALQNSFNQAYTDLLRQYSQTRLAMTAGFRFDAVIPAETAVYEDPAILVGQVSIEDAYRFFPVPFTLSTAEVSGVRLREVIESNLTAVFSSDIFKQSGGWFDGYAGITLKLDLARPDDQRIVALQYRDNGEAIQDDDVISISGCSRPFDLQGETTLCSYTGFDHVAPLLNPETHQAWTGVDFLIHGLQNGLLDSSANETTVTDTSATPLWPMADFYQPIEGVQ